MQHQTSPGGAFGLVVRFTVTAGREQAFDELTRATVDEIRRNEPGTLLYVCHQVEGSPSQRIFYELYRDRAAFEAHEAQPHVIHFLSRRGELLHGIEVDFMSPIAAAGVGEPQ